MNIVATVERLGLVMEPDGDPLEIEGTLNPACARDRSGGLRLYARVVAEGNVSRVGRATVSERDNAFMVAREGYVLEPAVTYEVREHPGFGCEDARVTYIPVLGKYVMSYTAFGPDGPRLAIATSEDAVNYERLGMMRFEEPGMTAGDDKDGAFFPEPVHSPNGVLSLAFYHRPMLHISAVDGYAAVPMIERLPFEDRESIRIGYVPLEPAIADPQALLHVAESVLVMSPDARWGSVKIGAGTPPVRIAEGWLSIFHGVDLIYNDNQKPKMRYQAGIMIHDIDEPHRLLYRSPEPILAPELEREQRGIVDNVVFPTGIDPRPDLGSRVFDFYYGMADYSIGAARLRLE